MSLVSSPGSSSVALVGFLVPLGVREALRRGESSLVRVRPLLVLVLVVAGLLPSDLAGAAPYLA